MSADLSILVEPLSTEGQVMTEKTIEWLLSIRALGANLTLIPLGTRPEKTILAQPQH